MEAQGAAGSYPPLDAGASPLRADQVLPLLSSLDACDTCPQGFMCSPWNSWGSYPVITTFQVPLDGVSGADMREWVTFVDDRRRRVQQCDVRAASASQRRNAPPLWTRPHRHRYRSALRRGARGFEGGGGGGI